MVVKAYLNEGTKVLTLKNDGDVDIKDLELFGTEYDLVSHAADAEIESFSKPGPGEEWSLSILKS
jgi:hypothetical protein